MVWLPGTERGLTARQRRSQRMSRDLAVGPIRSKGPAARHMGLKRRSKGPASKH